jgi:HAD superfamily hydrolase (TIGR01459 family)
MKLALPTFTEHFETLAPHYDVALCDVWGVVHNSLVSSPEACDALTRFRARGGTVILITNAPRPGTVVIQQLDNLAVPRDAFDGVVSSGDVTRAVIAKRRSESIFHLGPERDVGIFADLGIRFASADVADYVVCTGLFDDDADGPEDYRELLTGLRARDRFMVCANPDLVVERGSRLIHCAGALADLYRTLGGEVLYAGKPHRPIYDDALAMAASVRGHQVLPERVLAIGDSIRTDLKGAATLGIDCLFVTAGIHSEELGSREKPDARVLGEMFAAAGVFPTAVTNRLAW